LIREEERTVKALARLALGIFLSIILSWVWYIVAANYGYGALAGTYVFHGAGETCTLYLRPDRTFVQELSRSGQIHKSQGHWDRYGEAHVSFSNEFLKVSGEEMNTDGQAHGQFDKTLGIFPTLALAPLPNGPQFHKRLFH
jgi:4-amino-4-deoxy-L-arabinose transferase-like glycosyltransferase